MSNCSTFSKVALLACTLVYFCNMDNPKSHPIIVLGAVYLRIYDTSELVYPLSILSYSAWNKAMQLTQPKETNRASEAPTTVMMSRVIRAGRAGLSYLLYTLDWFGTSIHGTPIRHTSPRLIVVHKGLLIQLARSTCCWDRRVGCGSPFVFSAFENMKWIAAWRIFIMMLVDLVPLCLRFRTRSLDPWTILIVASSPFRLQARTYVAVGFEMIMQTEQ